MARDRKTRAGGVEAHVLQRPMRLERETRNNAMVALPFSATECRLKRNAVRRRKLFYKTVRLVAGLLVVVLATTAAAKVADQTVTWLTFAVWKPFTIADALRFWGIPRPRTPESLGVEKFLDSVLLWPGVAAYLVLAGASLFVFARADRALAKISRKYR
jgi:hypothetical protein